MHRRTNYTKPFDRARALVAWLGLLYLATGCATPGPAAATREPLVAAAARPLLTLDPHAVWTDAYNRLVELGPLGVEYLMNQPEMTRPAAPDDLRVLLHTSLIRALADPQSNPPRLSATCFETTLDLLHFDLKVAGGPLGMVVVLRAGVPRAWHELYPADFDHGRATRIDLEADRQALRTWWATHRDQPDSLVTHRFLRPQPAELWRLLGRRYADRWLYQPEPGTMLCAASQQEPTLFNLPTADYNLVRAACIWLGACSLPVVEAHLIELLAAPSPVVAHNAQFALGFSRNEQIQAVLRRYALDE